jgi:exo-beta-1,3-glucanase (GH17 family)
LAADGWLVGANVFEPDGTTFVYDYFAFPAPNGGPAFSAVATGEGGPEQGNRQLSIYSDYNNNDHSAGRIIEAIVFRERTIVPGDVGTIVTFTFDAKKGNIEGASTALAFIKTLDPGAGFATTNFVSEDTTNLPDTWSPFSISLAIDASLVGQVLQFGFQSRASNFEGSGVFYDNVKFGPEGCSGEGGVGIELRPLPEIYAAGNAINYGPFRGTGPGTGDIPSDANILEDLTLMDLAGFDLIRLFGADAISERILSIAQANFPQMQFQQGLFLEGLAPGPDQDNCQSTINDSQIATAIQLANTYSNVATVSVGNETSFFAAFMPLDCLEGYIIETRSNVSQPVTADDDYTFYAGLFGRLPDSILRQIDFVAIHMYPITNYRQWDWQQLGVPEGPLRAEAMMNAALAKAQDNFSRVYDYPYRDTSGQVVTIGESRPIVIGETGWKWRQTNTAQEIELYAGNPVNAKWYNDLMRSWERTPGGPETMMLFVSFDERWKGTDDGWGFWDELRNPLYALCDTPAGAPCNNPVYTGAGFYFE